MAPHMRAADAAEVWAQCAMLPFDALSFSVAQSEAYAALEDGSDVPVVIFGLARSDNILNGKRCFWLLGTPAVERYKKRFVRESAQYLYMIGAGHTVFNYVDVNNRASLRWLKWLGFTIMEPRPHGWLGKPFHYIEKVIPCVSSQQQQPQH